MILEHAILNVRPEQEHAFERAMREALPLIAATPGFVGIEVRPCIEAPGKYLLLVKWETLEAHTQSFRGSERYQEWKRLLHHFYDPFPVVEHYGARVAEMETAHSLSLFAETQMERRNRAVPSPRSRGEG